VSLADRAAADETLASRTGGPLPVHRHDDERIGYRKGILTAIVEDGGTWLRPDDSYGFTPTERRGDDLMATSAFPSRLAGPGLKAVRATPASRAAGKPISAPPRQ